MSVAVRSAVRISILAALEPLVALPGDGPTWMESRYLFDHGGEAWLLATNGKVLRAIHREREDGFDNVPLPNLYGDRLRPIFDAARGGHAALWVSRDEALPIVDRPWISCDRCEGRGSLNTCNACDHEHPCDCTGGMNRQPGTVRLGPLIFRCGSLLAAFERGPDQVEVRYRAEGKRDSWAAFVGEQGFAGSTRVVISIAVPLSSDEDTGAWGPVLGPLPTRAAP